MADEVEVTKRVSQMVSNLKLERDGEVMKASWKIPARMTSRDYADRAEWLDARIDFHVITKGGTTSGDVWSEENWPGGNAKDLSYTGYDYNWVKGLGLSTGFEKPYDRSRFHPRRSGRYCASVVLGVHGGNDSGVGGTDPSDPKAMGRGPRVDAVYEFKLPRKPTVKWEYDQNTHDATVTVKTDEGKDNYERYDTMVKIELRKENGEYVTLVDWTSTKLTEWTWTRDLSPYMVNLQAGKYVQLKCYAYARGMRGDNPDKSTPVEGERNVMYPVAPNLGVPTCDKKAANGRIKVPVKKHDEWQKNLQLQRRHGESGNWEDVPGAVDDNDAVSLYDSYVGANPQPGEYIYYRLKATRDGFENYSAEIRADCLFTAKPKTLCTATVGIVSATPVRGGTQANSTATVVIGFTDVTVNEGCELSWAEAKTAWNSNEGPSTYEYDGSGVAATGKYKRNRTVTLTGLTSGVTYYLKARRYRTVDNVKYYSDYSEFGSVTAESAENDSCGFDVITPGSTGTTCTLVLGINENNVNTGTEITWSDHSNAWQSNEQPELLNATWAKASYGVNGWAYKQTTYLRGLEPGTTYYVKARRYDYTGGATTYSPYSKTASFATPSLSENYDLRSGIVSVTGGEDGKSAEVVVGWSGDHGGCEVSWADDPDAWESSVQPSTADFDWEDDERRSTDWAKTGTFFLHGLEEGVTYYVRARTYVESGGERSYSAYSETFDVTPFSAPAGVSLSAPAAVARGESIEVFWTVDGDIDQTEWAIHEVGKPHVSLASGTGSLCRATIPASRYGDSDSISFYVESGYGGGLTQSNSVTVGIAEYPSCETACAPTLTAFPVTVEAYTDNPASMLLLTIRADGISFVAPDGVVDQMAGESVWTGSFTNAWQETTWSQTLLYSQLSQAVSDAEDALEDAEPGTDEYANAETALADAQAALAAHPADGTCYAAQVQSSGSRSFYDGGSYTASVQTVEPIAGLASDIAQAGFAVEWSHQAPTPSSQITVTPDIATRSVTIQLASPTGAASGDSYELYRKTPTGYEMVSSGLSLDTEVVDMYAPFGKDVDLEYRIACRTADGDVDYMDYPYSMPLRILRFDWDGGSLELPYNLNLSESYSKSFESRHHVDGSVNGYWEKGSEMSGSYSSDVIRMNTLEQVNAVRALAEHDGPVFCRTKDGMAFQCNAEVSEVGSDHMSPSLATAKVNVKAVKTTDDFMVKNGDGVGN